MVNIFSDAGLNEQFNWNQTDFRRVIKQGTAQQFKEKNLYAPLTTMTIIVVRQLYDLSWVNGNIIFCCAIWIHLGENIYSLKIIYLLLNTVFSTSRNNLCFASDFVLLNGFVNGCNFHGELSKQFILNRS